MNLLARLYAWYVGRPIQQWESLEDWKQDNPEPFDFQPAHTFTWTCWYCKAEFGDMASMNLHYYGSQDGGCNGDVVVEVPNFDEDWASYGQTVEYLAFEHDAQEGRLA